MAVSENSSRHKTPEKVSFHNTFSKTLKIIVNFITNLVLRIIKKNSIMIEADIVWQYSLYDRDRLCPKENGYQKPKGVPI